MVATLLATLRDQGRSVTWLARSLGVSRHSVHRWASGTRRPRAHRLRRAEELLALPPGALGLPVDPPPAQHLHQEAP